MKLKFDNTEKCRPCAITFHKGGYYKRNKSEEQLFIKAGKAKSDLCKLLLIETEYESELISEEHENTKEEQQVKVEMKLKYGTELF